MAEPMCQECGFIGMTKRVDIPDAAKKRILLHRVWEILLALLIPNFIYLSDIVYEGGSPYLLLLLLVHFAAIYFVPRASNRIKISNHFCEHCGTPFDLGGV